MIRSLEINWLKRYDRSLVVPEVVFIDKPTTPEGELVGGFYIEPMKVETLIDGKFIDCAFGVLVVGTHWGRRTAASTLAHEWRHHWQRHNGWTFDSIQRWEASGNWEKDIAAFFTTSRMEMDALLFERRVYPSISNEQMMDAVFGGT